VWCCIVISNGPTTQTGPGWIFFVWTRTEKSLSTGMFSSPSRRHLRTPTPCSSARPPSVFLRKLGMDKVGASVPLLQAPPRPSRRTPKPAPSEVERSAVSGHALEGAPSKLRLSGDVHPSQTAKRFAGKLSHALGTEALPAIPSASFRNLQLLPQTI
jgi:hypothetical protein